MESNTVQIVEKVSGITVVIANFLEIGFVVDPPSKAQVFTMSAQDEGYSLICDILSKSFPQTVYALGINEMGIIFIKDGEFDAVLDCLVVAGYVQLMSPA